MNLNPARVLASVVHAVVTEYRKIDRAVNPPPAPTPPVPPSQTEINNVAATTQTAWSPSVRQRANPFGFGKGQQ